MKKVLALSVVAIFAMMASDLFVASAEAQCRRSCRPRLVVNRCCRPTVNLNLTGRLRANNCCATRTACCDAQPTCCDAQPTCCDAQPMCGVPSTNCCNTTSAYGCGSTMTMMPASGCGCGGMVVEGVQGCVGGDCGGTVIEAPAEDSAPAEAPAVDEVPEAPAEDGAEA